MNDPNQPNRPNQPQETDRLIYAAFLGLSVAAMVQFIESKRDELDWGLWTAAMSFAVAIPLLSVGFINEYSRSLGIRISRERTWIALAGCLAAVVGLAALFFHVGMEAGIVFCVFVAIAFFAIKRT